MPVGQEKITIKFQAVGNKALRNAILELAKAQAILEKNAKQLSKAQKELEKNYRSASNATSDFERKQKLVNQRVQKNVTAFGQLQSTIAVYRNKLLLAAFAATAFSSTIGKLTSMFGEQELAERKLSSALGDVSQNLLDWAAAQQKVTTYGDEATISAMSQVAAFTKNEGAIKGITKAAQDMASAKGMDLKSTIDMITKSAYSSTNALSRYGIEIDNNLEGADRLNALLEELNEKWGGQAAAEAETFSGAVKQMGNAWGDVGEKIGESLGDSLLPLIKALTVLAVKLQELPLGLIIKAFGSLSVALLLTNKRLKLMWTSLGKTAKGMRTAGAATKAFTKILKTLKRAMVIFVAIEAAMWILDKIFGGMSASNKEQESSMPKVVTQIKRYGDEIKKTGNNLGQFEARQKKLKKIVADSKAEYKDTQDEVSRLTSAYGKFYEKNIGAYSKAVKHFTMWNPAKLWNDEAENFKAGISWKWERIEQMKHAIELAKVEKKASQSRYEADKKELKELEEQLAEVVKLIDDYNDKISKTLQFDIKDIRIKGMYEGWEREYQKILMEAEKAEIPIDPAVDTLLKDRLQVKYLYMEQFAAEAKAIKQNEDLQERYVKGGLTQYDKMQKSITDTQKEYNDELDRFTKLKEMQAKTGNTDKDLAEDMKRSTATMKTLQNNLKLLRGERDKLQKQGLDTTFLDDEKAIKALYKEIEKLGKTSKTESESQKELYTEIEKLKWVVFNAGGNVEQFDLALSNLNNTIKNAPYADVLKMAQDYNDEIKDQGTIYQENRQEIADTYNELIKEKAVLEQSSWLNKVQKDRLAEINKQLPILKDGYNNATQAHKDYNEENKEEVKTYKDVIKAYREKAKALDISAKQKEYNEAIKDIPKLSLDEAKAIRTVILSYYHLEETLEAITEAQEFRNKSQGSEIDQAKEIIKNLKEKVRFEEYYNQNLQTTSATIGDLNIELDQMDQTLMDLYKAELYEFLSPEQADLQKLKDLRTLFQDYKVALEKVATPNKETEQQIKDVAKAVKDLDSQIQNFGVVPEMTIADVLDELFGPKALTHQEAQLALVQKEIARIEKMQDNFGKLKQEPGFDITEYVMDVGKLPQLRAALDMLEEALGLKPNVDPVRDFNTVLKETLGTFMERRDVLTTDVGIVEAWNDEHKDQVEAIREVEAAGTSLTLEQTKLLEMWNFMQLVLKKLNAELGDLNDELTDPPDIIPWTNWQNVLVDGMENITSAFIEAGREGTHMGRAVEKAIKDIAAQIAAKAAAWWLLSTVFGVNIGGFKQWMGWTGSPDANLQGGAIKKYAMGGFVPYSYAGGGNVDTVPAMLSEGEFVMNRRAVDSIGIENLNRMNRTGETKSDVNITFTGNVMSRDFIENEAIPKIKDAIRRGADLGIS